MADPKVTRRRLSELIDVLQIAVQNDGEQEAQGMALPVLDAVLVEARGLLGDDPVVQAAREVISVEAIESGETVRALDALLVARQLRAALGPEPGRLSTPRGRLDRGYY